MHRKPASNKVRKHFSRIRCLSVYALGPGAAIGPTQGGSKIPASLPERLPLQSTMTNLRPAARWLPQLRLHLGRLTFCRIRCLVTIGRAFYNPRNTALDIVVFSIRDTVLRHPAERIENPANECLSNDSTSASPRSTE